MCDESRARGRRACSVDLAAVANRVFERPTPIRERPAAQIAPALVQAVERHEHGRRRRVFSAQTRAEMRAAIAVAPVWPLGPYSSTALLSTGGATFDRCSPSVQRSLARFVGAISSPSWAA